MKHKFVKTEGCTAFDFAVDGESLADMSREKEFEIFEDLMEKLWEKFDSREINLQDIVEMFDYDDYKYEKERCDTCGDTVSWTTWEI